ncbi:MAG: HAD-IIB family hydrolase [Candidatus Heimdallarchaeota archaeon]
MNTIILFDVDGTLTLPRSKVEPEILRMLAKLKNNYSLGVVGGSDFQKIQEQLVTPLEELFDYVFCENGMVAYKGKNLIGQKIISEEIGESNLQRLLNFVLKYISELDLPIKRGTFIVFRNGMLNISPIGRNCSQKERIEFESYDKENKIRETLVNELKLKFQDLDLSYTIGGQISFDVFPKGWDKTQCLQYLTNDFDTIYFFGDKIEIGGNDHELYNSDFTIGYHVKNPNDTLKICSDLFL